MAEPPQIKPPPLIIVGSMGSLLECSLVDQGYVPFDHTVIERIIDSARQVAEQLPDINDSTD